jgi:hypothetical protein
MTWPVVFSHKMTGPVVFSHKMTTVVEWNFIISNADISCQNVLPKFQFYPYVTVWTTIAHEVPDLALAK